mmetsp:Transcript_21814/g.3618  ORF Transcript_21814/g.3618 Transcript_21814/m.3618 type:complete len:101 (-) Transcript_21814:97-399(-)
MIWRSGYYFSPFAIFLYWFLFLYHRVILCFLSTCWSTQDLQTVYDCSCIYLSFKFVKEKNIMGKFVLEINCLMVLLGYEELGTFIDLYMNCFVRNFVFSS